MGSLCGFILMNPWKNYVDVRSSGDFETPCTPVELSKCYLIRNPGKFTEEFIPSGLSNSESTDDAWWKFAEPLWNM